MPPITHNPAASRYEQTTNGQTVFADYRREGDILYITHVEAPPVLRGTGAVSVFMKALMEKLREENIRKVMPVCSYAAAWLTRHAEFADML